MISPAACTDRVVFRIPGLPPMIPFTSADGSAIVRMLNCAAAFGSSGRAPCKFEPHLGRSGRQRLPIGRALPRSAARSPARKTARAAARSSPAVTAPRQDLGIKHVDGVQRRAAVHARVEIALPRRHLDVEGDEPARREAEHRHVDAEHSAVEDDARVRAPLVLLDPVDDRRSADLLLAVAREAEVDRQRVLLDEPLRGLEQDVDLPLVVGDAARVCPVVADRQLEGVRLPQVERRRGLHVEMAVDEDGGRVVGIHRRADLTERELLLAVRDELGGSAALRTDEVADPLARPLHVLAVRGVRAHARDRDELSELAAPGLVHEAGSYAGGALGRRGDPPRPRSSGNRTTGNSYRHGTVTEASRHGPLSAAFRDTSVWVTVTGLYGPSVYATSRSENESLRARSFLRLWFSICRMRSRVTLNVRPTSSSVRGCSPSSP